MAKLIRIYNNVTGLYGIGSVNHRGERVASFAVDFNLRATSTFFQHRDHGTYCNKKAIMEAPFGALMTSFSQEHQTSAKSETLAPS